MALVLDAPRPVAPDIHDDATRREFLAGAGAALLLAACGADEATDTAAPTTTEADSAFPVNIEHKFGSTEIPDKPRRLLSLGFDEHDYILALGVSPVALRYELDVEDDGIYPWAKGDLALAEPKGDPEVMSFPDGLNFERIAALEPDVILGVNSGMDDQDYETLSQIAPTVAQSDEFVDFGSPWQETTRIIGRALGREQRAEDLVDELEARFAVAREGHPEFDGLTVASVALFEGQYGFFTSQDNRIRPFTALGLELPDALDKIAGGKFFGSISAEQVGLLDTDVLVFPLGSSEEEVESARESIDSDPFLQNPTAVRDGRVVFLEGELNHALTAGTVLSLPVVLDEAVPMLAAALAG